MSFRMRKIEDKNANNLSPEGDFEKQGLCVAGLLLWERSG